MQRTSMLLRMFVVMALMMTPLTSLPLHAQEVVPIDLDAGGFGIGLMDALEAGAEAQFTLELAEGDRVAMDLQGETDDLQVAAFLAPWGNLYLGGIPEAFNYLAWAPEDGVYTVAVENTGKAAAGFVLRVVVSPAPLPTNKILTLDADGETIPVAVGEAFQVALAMPGDMESPWQLDEYDPGIVSEASTSAMVLLSTMPGAMQLEIFTFVGMAPGATTLTFTNPGMGKGADASFSATIEVMGLEEEPQPQVLALNAEGMAQAAGTLDPQGMASFVLAIDAGASVQAEVLPGDSGLVLTVVGANGNPLQTDHTGASTFNQLLPVSQEYTFRLINLGEETQAYQFGLLVTPAADDDLALGAQLVMHYFDALRDGDSEAVAALLSPVFQIVRATGERYDAGDYLDNLPIFEAYEVSHLKVTRTGNILVASYAVRTDTTLDGDGADFQSFAPRLTVFQQNDETWELVAHANFAAPAEGLEMLTMPEAQIMITDADDGGTVEVAAGGMVEVELPGNPTTGYIWQVTANDESILLPLYYEFVPDADAMGAGGVERFGFLVMAPGTVALELANSRPWETDIEPEETFAVNVEALNEWSGDDAMITVGAEENGEAVTILPGGVLLVTLAGAPDGEWLLVQSDPMVVQPLGGWWNYPGDSDPTQAQFHRYFLGVAGGTAELQFEYLNADGSMTKEGYALTVEVPPLEPGFSGAVAANEMDAGSEFALVVNDTLVVRVDANPTTGYDWRVVSTDEARLPAASDPVFAGSTDLSGAGGVLTFRFLARAAGEATVQIGEFAPGAETPDRTFDFSATIADPASLTGNTVELSAADNGSDVQMTAGDWLQIVLEENASTGYLWTVAANDGAVLRFVPTIDATVDAAIEDGLAGAGGNRIFMLRALQPGVVDLEIALFPPGSDEAEELFAVIVTVE